MLPPVAVPAALPSAVVKEEGPGTANASLAGGSGTG
jgi:hypothetical protein